MEPVSNVGRFTRILLIIIGIVLIVTGAVLTTMQFTAIGEPQTTATITGFRTISEQNVPDKATVTIVSYSIDGKKYDDVELGQYEEQWKPGDKLNISYSPDDPEKINTKTMVFLGPIVILASLPFIIVGIYTLMNFNRQAAKTPEEIAEDEERTTAGKLKYKVSSIVISLATGIPVTLMGLVMIYLEHKSVLGMLTLILGVISTIVGLRSIVLFIIIKYRHKKELNRMINNNNKKLLSAPGKKE